MKKILLVLIATSIAFFAFSQGYKSLETIDGVNISYMVVNQGNSDDTPAVLRLKFKNDTKNAVIITYQVGYGVVSKTDNEYETVSEEFTICISKNAVKMGEVDGLIIEITDEEAKIITRGKSDWGFSIFDVVPIDKCNNVE